MHAFALLFSRFRSAFGLLIAVLVIAGPLSAADQVYSDQKDRPDFLGGDNVEVTDSWYSYMVANPTTWNQQFHVSNLKNYVILSVNHDDFASSASDFTADVQVEITTYVQSGSSFVPVNTIKTLTIEKSSIAPYDDKVIFEVPNPGHRMFVDIVPTDPSTAAMYATYNLKVEGRVEVERFFTFNTTIVPSGLTPSLNGTSGDLEVSWPTVPGAEAYELEWTHYFADNSSTFPKFKVDNLRFNATRITTKQQQYPIPMLYDKGWVVYRVRALGRTPDDAYQTDIPGKWSSDAFLGGCSSITSTLTCYNHKYYFSGHEGKFNWQSTVAFAEAGKSKQVINYHDGSNLARQVQTRVNSDQRVIVSERIYDFAGRPAIATMPVPITTDKIGYRSNFNQKDGSTQAYHASHFDKLMSDLSACDPVPLGMSTNSGASKYYSPSSDFAADYPEIPNAEKYPFSHTIYMPDNSGRIKAQSGVGAPFRTGNGHTTQTFYGKPFQEELDMLFASDAGYAEFYQKQMVIDPNGQVMVSFSDLAGNVITTGLEGDVPSNVMALDDASTYNLQVDLLNKLLPTDNSGSGNKIVDNGRTLESNTTFLLTSEQVLEVTYEMPGQVFSDNCAGTVNYADGTSASYSDDFCYECIYDLTVSLKDDCGEEYLYRKTAGNPSTHTTSVVGQSILDDFDNETYTEVTCPVSNPPSFNSTTDITFPSGGLKSNDQSAPLSLGKGSYTLNKRLSINEDALNYYTQHYLENNDCILDYNYFEIEAIQELNFDGCGLTCDQCTTSVNALLTEGYTQVEVDALLEQCGEMCGSESVTCKGAYTAMLSDMSPNGQYGKVSPGSGMMNGQVVNGQQGTAGNIDASPFELSVFNIGNYLPRKNLFLTNNVEPDWKHPMFPTGGSFVQEYRDPNGSPSLILLDDLGSGNYDPAITGSPQIIGGFPYAKPQQLVSLEVFVANWKSNWAQSLVVYHPEYEYYVQCQARESSNLFDEEVMTMDYADAVTAGYHVVPSGSGNPAILVSDPYFTTGNQEFLAAKYFMKNFSLKDPGGPSYYSMYDVAKILINNPGQGSFAQCNTLPTPNGVNLTLEEWEMFRSLYVSLKQKFLAYRDRQIAINNGYFNGCIGVTDFDAFRFNFFQNGNNLNNGPILAHYGITSWPNLASQFFNVEQPCNFATYSLYKNKIARFATAAQYLGTQNANEGGCGYSTSTYGEYSNLHSACEDYVNNYSDELGDKAAASFLESCGVCPIAKDLETLLNVAADPAQNDLISGSGSQQLTCLGAGNPYLVYTPALNEALLSGATPSGNASWTGLSNPAGTEVKVALNYGVSPLCTLQLKFNDPNNGYTVADIESFCCVKLLQSPSIYPMYQNSNFTIQAIVDDGNGGTEKVSMEGVLPCLNLLDCEADILNCKPSPVALQLQRLFNGLVQGGPGSPISQGLWFGSSNIGTGIHRQIMGDELFQAMHAALNSSSTDINQGPLQWSSTTVGSMLSVQLANASGSTCSIEMNFNGINVAQITRIFNIRPYLNGGLGTFTAEVEITNGSTVTFTTVIGEAPCFDFGTCGNDALEIFQDTEATEAYDCDLTTYGSNLDFASIISSIVPAGELGGSYAVPGSISECQLHFTIPSTLGKTKAEIAGYSIIYADQSQLLADGSTYHFYFFLEMIDGTMVKVTGYSECDIISICDGCYFEELVANGTFESVYFDQTTGVTGFPGYTMNGQFVNNPNLASMTPAGWPVNNYSVVLGGFPCTYCPINGDHTYPDPTIGNYLVFYSVGGGNAPIWNHSVNVLPDVDYVFSAHFSRLEFDDGNLRAELTINGNVVHSEFASIVLGEWVEIRYTWNSGTATTANLELAFQTDPGWGDAIALDDISFGPDCPKTCVPVELLTNGNLEQGMNGYTSTYTYDGSLMLDNSYSFANQVSYGSILMNDHTYPSTTQGQFLRFENLDRYSWQNLLTQGPFTVEPNTDYLFEYWYEMPNSQAGPIISASINGVQTTNYYYTFDDYTVPFQSVWRKATYLWNSGNSTTATVSVLFRHDGDKTSSVYIDDLSFKKYCSGSDLICDLQPTAQFTQPDPCVTNLMNIAQQNAELAYNSYIEEVTETFQANLIEKCTDVYEKLEMEYDISSANQYTLFYYDQAGKLVRTIPPAGVDLLQDPAKLAQVKVDRENGARSVHPKHTLATTYHYNSLGQLVEQSSPDMENRSGGVSSYAKLMWYDELGRLVISQNSKQEIENRFSYTLFDDLGRISETGEIRTPGLPGDAITTLLNSKGQVDYSSYLTWLGNVNYQKYEIAQTFYNSSPYTSPNTQENLRNRIASVIFEKVDDGDPQHYDFASFYSYDIHGNVKQLVQEFHKLNDFGQRFKVLDYDYDLVSGNVNQITFQKGFLDEMNQRYFYDSDNRLTKVWVSIDGYTWDEDADYEYLPHGPLKRTELGELKVQGTDYAYSLQGWLKGANSESLKPESDMGIDGNHLVAANLNNYVAKDEVGYSIGYFNEGADIDYKSVGTTQFLANRSGSNLDGALVNRSLYDGNINHVVTAIGHFMQQGVGPQAMRYRYDQLKRIKEGRVERGFDRNLNTWTAGNTDPDDYFLVYKYDKNGNISNLFRNGATNAGGLDMDDLNYEYYSNSNRLKRVGDASPGTTNYDNDLEAQGANNYVYDKIGNLKSDNAECIKNIDWYASGKVKSIERIPGCKVNNSYPPDLEFGYNALGQRVEKLVKSKDGLGNLQDQSHWKYSYYALDAVGNAMAYYERTFESEGNGWYTDEMKLTERPIYGSDRIGLLGSDKRMAKVRYTATVDQGTKSFTVGSAIKEVSWIEDLDQVSQYKSVSSIENGKLKIEADGQYSGALLRFPTTPGETYNVSLDLEGGTPVKQWRWDVRNNTGSWPPLYNAGNLSPGSFTASFTATTSESMILFYHALTSAQIIANDLESTFFIDNLKITSSAGKNIVYRDFEGGDHVTRHDHGNKRFELKNHTEHVLSVITDRRKSENCTLYENYFLTQGDVGQFTAAGAVLTLDNSSMKIVTGGLYHGANKTVNVIAGEPYHLTATLSAGTAPIVKLIVYDLPGYGYLGAGTVNTSNGIVSLNFTPTTSQISIRIENLNFSNTPFEMYLHDIVVQQTNCISFDAEVVAANDYYPFGWTMPGRSWYAPNGAYRYGANGMEKDNEVKGAGNSYTSFFRQYDPRLGRWFSIDPAVTKYPSMSPYTSNVNNPIRFLDSEGDDPITGIADAATAFVLEAGTNFLSHMLLEGDSPSEAFDKIEWSSASVEAGKAYFLSFFTPTGTAVARKIHKISKSKIGKVSIDLVDEFVTELTKKYMLGAYNDEDGDFDSDKLFNLEELTGLFIHSALGALINQGFSKRADELIGEFRKLSGKYDKILAKYEKQLREEVNGSKKHSNYQLGVTSQQLRKVAGEKIKHKAKTEVFKTGGQDSVNGQVDKVKDKYEVTLDYIIKVN